MEEIDSVLEPMADEPESGCLPAAFDPSAGGSAKSFPGAIVLRTQSPCVHQCNETGQIGVVFELSREQQREREEKEKLKPKQLGTRVDSGFTRVRREKL